jgi:hypothetical protein
MGDWEGAKYLKWVVPLCVAISTFGAANGTLFVAGRLAINKYINHYFHLLYDFHSDNKFLLMGRDVINSFQTMLCNIT